MNAVDIYISGERLDVFQDEEITLNRSIENYKDLDKVFTDYSQSFTVPATPNNNRIFSHYYDPSVISGFDARLRVIGRIEINSLPFRDGVIELESVQITSGEPSSYTLTFYGFLVNLTDLFGEDYLYQLDLSAYNHTYNSATILTGFNQNALFTDEVCYPLMSAEDEWYYNSSPSDTTSENIAWNNSGGSVHGIIWDDLKPALAVSAIIDAIVAKYGINITVDIEPAATFADLFLWLHRHEGKLFAGADDIAWTLIDFDNTITAGSFDLATDQWTVAGDDNYDVTARINNVAADYEVGLFVNGVLKDAKFQDAHASTSKTHTFYVPAFYEDDVVELRIRPQAVGDLTWQCTSYKAVDQGSSTTQFEVSQTTTQTASFTVDMSALMPEMKVKDFIAAIVKMHNALIYQSAANTLTIQDLNGYYADGATRDISKYFDITTVESKRPDIPHKVSFKYQETEQILGQYYKATNEQGFGDLEEAFNVSGGETEITLPTECPLFGLLTDEKDNSLTNVLIYSSVNREIDEGTKHQDYIGAPVFLYCNFSLDISANPVEFVDDVGGANQIDTVWWANVSSSQTLGQAYSLCFGADIDPYHLQSVGNSLFRTYWSDYITDLYNISRRVVLVDAVLPLGEILTLKLNDSLIWNNAKWRINNVDMNLTTGKCRFELLNEV